MATARDLMTLIERYVIGDLDPRSFVSAYLRSYADVPYIREELYQVLETVFGEADSYDPSVTPETATIHHVTEETLRLTCEQALARLRTMDLDQGDNHLP